MAGHFKGGRAGGADARALLGEPRARGADKCCAERDALRNVGAVLRGDAVSQSALFGYGYSAPVERLRGGTVAPLHALDPGTRRAVCGERLSVSWEARDASPTTVDCVACLAVLQSRSAA